MNQLYFGDNLDILKSLHKQYPSGIIDLIYIDPPFNSKRNYNILFESVDLKNTVAQKEAFADTWTNVHYIDELNEIKEIDFNLHRFIESLEIIGISTSAVSYLTTMAIRIWYMHKLLKPTGSFYLHCDPNMSHYLKVVCDLIFLPQNFGNEITWQRTNAHSDAKKKFPDVNDIILYYKKSKKTKFSPQYTKHNKEYITKFYRHDDKDGKGLYTLDNMASPSPRPNMMYEWKGFSFPDKGWRYELSTMKKLDKEGRVYYPKNKNNEFDFTKRPRLKRYLVEQKGTVISNNWTDISPLGAHEKERLGYPTQKHIKLMERIIKASSNEGDLVADFFCGCGTTIAAAHRLKRRWIGVDISHLAIKLISNRLVDNNYGGDVINSFEVHGFPKDIASAKALSLVKGGRLEFEEWIIEVMLHGVLNQQHNKTGYDGYITLSFHGKKRVGFIEVKSGSTSLSHLNHFIKTIEDNKVEFGIFVCFAQHVTKGMRIIAKKAGYFDEDNFQKTHDKIQIITVEQLLNNEIPNLPESSKTTFKKAARKTLEKDTQIKFDL